MKAIDFKVGINGSREDLMRLLDLENARRLLEADKKKEEAYIRRIKAAVPRPMMLVFKAVTLRLTKQDDQAECGVTRLDSNWKNLYIGLKLSNCDRRHLRIQTFSLIFAERYVFYTVEAATRYVQWLGKTDPEKLERIKDEIVVGETALQMFKDYLVSKYVTETSVVKGFRVYHGKTWRPRKVAMKKPVDTAIVVNAF